MPFLWSGNPSGRRSERIFEAFEERLELCHIPIPATLALAKRKAHSVAENSDAVHADRHLFSGVLKAAD
jgi:hypothetical protein